MVINEGENKAIQKRLAAIEEAIDELRMQDLELASQWAMSYCFSLYTFVLLALRGEKRKEFIDTWNKRREEVKGKVVASQTPQEATEIAISFAGDLADYLGATKVATAEEAIDIAHSFIKKYSVVALPLKAVKEDDTWLVDIDVGALAVKIAKVKVDARTGDILSHEIPER